MNRSHVILFFLLLQLLFSDVGVKICAQNLVPNPSFEGSNCPDFVAQLPAAPPWRSPTNTTPDYLNECATHPWVDVPLNAFGYQHARTGVAYAGAQYRGTPFGNREYCWTPLLEPLIAGHEYEISYWVSLADEYCGVNQFGAYFSIGNPGPPEIFGVLNVDPQFSADTIFITDTANWVLISGCFVVATGGETHMTIGNFSTEYETPLDSNCTVSGDSYYYLDDVSLVDLGPAGTFELGLEDQVVTCGPYEIDPQIPNATYIWEDGSTDSTLTVTQQGVYSVTVTTLCIIGIDSVEVIFHGNESVDIGPPQITMCEGETYSVSLDPVLNSYLWQDGSTDPDYTITTSGVYAVTLDDGCEVSTDEIQVTVIPPPEPFSLSEQTILCPGDQIEFFFDPDVGEYIWQDGSFSTYYSITEPGYYALTITNSCGTESDSVTVFSIVQPVADLGPDSLLLCQGDTVEIYFNPDMAYFDWHDGSHGNTYTIIGPGVYALTITNDCGSSDDSMEVFYFVTPSFDLGPDSVLCADSLVLDPGFIPGSIYHWQDSTSAQTLVVNQNGIYSLVVSNACDAYTDSVSVSFHADLPVPNLGSDLMLCPGETYVLSPDIPDATYLWQDSSTLDSFIVTTGGTYAIQVANACNAFSDTIVVTYSALPPQVDLPQSAILCIGDSIMLDAGISGVGYLWSDGSSLSTLAVHSPGSYSLTVSNACGSDADTIKIVDGGPAPFVELGNNIQLCAGDTIILSPNHSNVDTWLWNDGSALQTFDVTTSGSISVSASNSCGISYDTVIASLLSAVPLFSLGNDTSLCPGNTIMLSVNTPDVSILWSDGSSGNDLIVSNPGEYFATISNSCGESADTLQVDILPAIPPLDLGTDQSLCPGELIVIDPGIPDIDYVWQDGSTSNTYSTTQPETIILQISNACGTTSDTLLIIESTEGPQVDLGADIVGCIGESITVNSGISGVDYVWQDGSVASSFTTSVSGEIILTVSNNCGVDTDTLLVDLSGIAPYVDLGPDTVLCDGLMLLLEINALPVSFVEWQDGSSQQFYEVTSPGVYHVTSANVCGEDSDTIVVALVFAPSPFDLGPDTTLCPGEFLPLPSPMTPDLITWQDGSHEPTMIADIEQTYSLLITNMCGNAFDEILVSFDNAQPVVDLDPLITWCPEETISLDVTQDFPASYLWSTGSTSSAIDIITPDSYTVTVFTTCTEVQQSVDVILDDDCFPKTSFYVPNVFSPNGDGINDVFTIGFSAELVIESIQCSIFDRWGNLIFVSNDIPFIWTGEFDRKPLHPGVYTYLIHINYTSATMLHSSNLSGDVTLVR